MHGRTRSSRGSSPPARDLHGKIIDGRKPSTKFPLRSLSNVRDKHPEKFLP